MLNWFKPKRVPESQTVQQTEIGEMQIDSRTRLLGEPTYLYDPVRIEGVPPGWFPRLTGAAAPGGLYRQTK